MPRSVMSCGILQSAAATRLRTPLVGKVTDWQVLDDNSGPNQPATIVSALPSLPNCPGFGRGVFLWLSHALQPALWIKTRSNLNTSPRSC